MPGIKSSTSHVLWRQAFLLSPRQEKVQIFVSAYRGTKIGKGESFLRNEGPQTLALLMTASGWLAERLQNIRQLAELERISLEIYLSQDAALRALWVAYECAALDLLAQENQQTLEQFLNFQPLRELFKFNASIMDIDEQKTFARDLEAFVKTGVSDYKLQLQGDFLVDLSRVQLFQKTMQAKRVVNPVLKLGAQGVWTKEKYAHAEAFLDTLDYPVLGLEEPFAVEDLPLWEKLAKKFKLPMIVSRSLSGITNLEMLSQDVNWIFRLNFLELGGFLQSLKWLQVALEKRYPIIVAVPAMSSATLLRQTLSLAAQSSTQLSGIEYKNPNLEESLSSVQENLVVGQGGYLWLPSQLRRSGLGLSLKTASSLIWQDVGKQAT